LAAERIAAILEALWMLDRAQDGLLGELALPA
jgi:hypothetical protein